MLLGAVFLLVILVQEHLKCPEVVNLLVVGMLESRPLDFLVREVDLIAVFPLSFELGLGEEVNM